MEKVRTCIDCIHDCRNVECNGYGDWCDACEHLDVCKTCVGNTPIFPKYEQVEKQEEPDNVWRRDLDN